MSMSSSPLGSGSRIGTPAAGAPAAVTTLLVIEDDPGFAGLLTEIFCREPDLYLIGVAPTIAVGLAWLRRRTPGVVLTDYQLGDGTGAQVVPVVRRLAPGTLVVIMSCDASGEARAAAEGAGADGFLDKAVPPRCFSEVIRSLIGSGRLRA